MLFKEKSPEQEVPVGPAKTTRDKRRIRPSTPELDIYDHAPVMMCQVDENFRVVRANRAVLEFTGRQAEEALGMQIGELLGCHHAFAAGHGCGKAPACENCSLRLSMQDALRSERKNRRRVEFKPAMVREARPQETVLMVSSTLIKVAGEPSVLVCLEDISQQKRAQEQVREQAALLEIAPDAIMVHDLSGHILFWNRGAESLYGWKVEEALGQDIECLLFKLNPAELVLARQVVLSKEEWIGELHQITRDRREVVVQSRWALVRDWQGDPKSILSVGTDVTDQKKLEAQLLRAQRMETVGTLASGIAHDINNVLTPILMAASLLSRKYHQPECQRILETIEATAKRGASIIQQLLVFGRGSSEQHLILQPKHLLKEMERMALQMFPKSISLETVVAPHIWTISGNATHLHQVLLNLCVNAKDAMPEGGTLTLSLENVLIDSCFAQMKPHTTPGPYVLLTVSDTGTGIPREIMDRIFDPFFTTKGPGKGTGLGLATVMNIVKNHGGFIQVLSERGNGTQFKVYLPARPNESIATMTPEFAPPMAGNGEWVLVADDEAAVRKTVQQFLASSGYNVLTATDGAETLALYVENRDKISVALIDMTMPSLDGATTIRVLQKLNPQVRIIAAGEMMPGRQQTNWKGLAVQATLPKPYTGSELLAVIGKALDSH
ncbi:MAG: PAS domain S-box protein [Candidatus Omnitrophica bacterium]|nr:PAS domain S-box protein [Candidatus Omnitrophota bacterium]